MASMNRNQRAQHYLERLMSARNTSSEIDLILAEIEGLIYSTNNEALSRQDKLLIIEELERLIRGSRYSINESIGTENLQKSTSASDNSDILDVISAMKKRVR
ncbi:hypothetical protein L4D77_26365 [Photobacterium frigidiphilum]|uniref:hypothetical protein n=1 Tax=Photobacterium frigidiphilum TaxID=264736 RepID=UPI003D137498